MDTTFLRHNIISEFLSLANSALDGHSLAFFELDRSLLILHSFHSLSPNINQEASFMFNESPVDLVIKHKSPIFLSYNYDDKPKSMKPYSKQVFIKCVFIAPVQLETLYGMLYFDSLKSYDIPPIKQKLIVNFADCLAKLYKTNQTMIYIDKHYIDYNLLYIIQKKIEHTTTEMGLLASLKYILDQYLNLKGGFAVTLPSKHLMENKASLYIFGNMISFKKEDINLGHSTLALIFNHNKAFYAPLANTPEPLLGHKIDFNLDGFVFITPLEKIIDLKSAVGFISTGPISKKDRFVLTFLAKIFIKRLIELKIKDISYLKDPYTDLPNGIAFEKLLTYLTKKGSFFSLMLIEIIGSKYYKETHGFIKTGALMRKVAESFKVLTGPDLFVFTLNLGEFVIICKEDNHILDFVFHNNILPVINLINIDEIVFGNKLTPHISKVSFPMDADNPAEIIKIMYAGLKD